MQYKHTKLYLVVLLLLIVILPLFSGQARKNFSKPLHNLLYKNAHANFSMQEEDTLRLLALEAENTRLRTELEAVKEWLLFDEKIAEDVSALKALNQKANYAHLREFCQRRADALALSLEKKLHALPARIIMRDFSCWNAAFWIGIGTKDNELCGQEIVAPFSPVVVGNTVVGIVEEVHEMVSKVKMIFDPQLSIAVRVARGQKSKQITLEHIHAVLNHLENISEQDEEGKVATAIFALKEFKEHWQAEEQDLYLAKGEIKGQGVSKLKSQKIALQGIGFNYHFTDLEGKARDLRTGKSSQGDALKIVEEGDLLITSGLDGVFPEGLHVARVSKVFPLQEGQCWFNLEAQALTTNLHDLKYVFILPPMPSL